ncbi:hypothetical protein ACU4GD_38910 [Cupriavidus basilensis]
MVETIPGKTCMGLELPNARRQMIRLSEIVAASSFLGHNSNLVLAMGKDITGNPVVTDLARAPHCCWWLAPPARASQWRSMP